MNEAHRIELAIATIERRRDRLQRRAHDLLGGSTPNLQQERQSCLNQAKALVWALEVLAEK